MEIGTIIEVYWNDISTYDEIAPHRLASAQTKGSLVRETPEYLIIAHPETVLTDASGHCAIHPDIEMPPQYYYIPNSLIQKIVTYE